MNWKRKYDTITELIKGDKLMLRKDTDKSDWSAGIGDYNTVYTVSNEKDTGGYFSLSSRTGRTWHVSIEFVQKHFRRVN